MPRVISVHEYVLKPGVNPQEFERAISKASRDGLLQLPGLIEHYFLKGIRGAREGQYTAVWIFESQDSWSELWGPVGQPMEKSEYPRNWQIWEQEVLAPFLAQDPDQIRFSAYLEI
jgi:hypothetical protein